MKWTFLSLLKQQNKDAESWKFLCCFSVNSQMVKHCGEHAENLLDIYGIL